MDDGGFSKRESADDRPAKGRAARYAWVIDEDHTGEGEQGTYGPANISPEQQVALQRAEGRRFRMYDDDNELYYEGRLIGGDGFEPLDDYGTPNAGCTRIDYRNAAGEWETL